jgi:hypothetical protein
MKTAWRWLIAALACCGAGCGGAPAAACPEQAGELPVAVIDEAALAPIEASLAAEHGEAERERIRLGLRQAAERWWPEDGGVEDFRALAEEHFFPVGEALDETARHLEYALEMLDGHANEADIELGTFQDLERGPLRPVDALLAAYSPTAHIDEDLFRSGVALAVLLNFPVTTLEQRVAEGTTWSRDRWARARLAGRFENRVPAEVLQEIEEAGAGASLYIDSYNIRMDRLFRGGEAAGFAGDLRLISHWGLREEIRAQYGQEGGIDRQRLVARVMDRIVLQEIPAEVIDSDATDWDPETNLVREAGGTEWREAEREPDVRYAKLLDVFHAAREADPYYPTLPTHVARSFEIDREMSEARVRELLERVLASDVAARVGGIIAARLGRPLEPFDLWYTGFRPVAALDEDDLTRTTRERYVDAEAFRADLPRILGRLGFSAGTAAFLAERIVVEPSRGPGMAVGAMLRDGHARLRTRVGPAGMDYKGYNIAVHELGHTVEQVFSMSRIDHTLLQGVPNTGFTEAFAFLFQARDLELIDRAPPPDPQADALRAIDRVWDAFEIAGVALIDVEIWRWMYEHPAATPAEVREAMVAIARDVWNRYYAPVFGVRDSTILAIYSHIIAYGLYTPDYLIGMVITAQVEDYVRSRDLATEMERMCVLGRLAPDVWMQQAVGAPVTADALLDAAGAALEQGVR